MGLSLWFWNILSNLENPSEHSHAVSAISSLMEGYRSQMGTIPEPKNAHRIATSSVNMKRLPPPKEHCSFKEKIIIHCLWNAFLDTRCLLPESKETGGRDLEHGLLGYTCHLENSRCLYCLWAALHVSLKHLHPFDWHRGPGMPISV